MSQNARIRRKLERQRRRNALAAANPINCPAPEPSGPQATQPPEPQAHNPSVPQVALTPQPPAPQANHQIASLSAVSESPNHQIPPSAPHAALRPETVSRRWSILDRLPPELLVCMEEQVLETRPREYKQIYESLLLAELGVTYSAFYRYARRLRSRAALQEAADFKPEHAHAAERELPRLYATRLVEALTLDHPSPLHLKRLAEGYSLVARAETDFWRNLIPRPPRSRALGDVGVSSGPGPSLEAIIQAFGDLLENRQPTADVSMPPPAEPSPGRNGD